MERVVPVESEDVDPTCLCGHLGPTGRVRLVTTGPGQGSPAEHDGPGSTCPPDKRGTSRRALRGAAEWHLGRPSAQRAGFVCSSGQPELSTERHGTSPAGQRVSNRTQRSSTCVPQRVQRSRSGASSGAKVHDLRTLAGATVKVPSVHRIQRVSTCVPLRVRGRLPRVSTGLAQPTVGLSFGHGGRGRCLFIRAGRTSVPNTVRGVEDHR